MGIMTPYFPVEMALKLAKKAQADTFIETGTYMGGTSKWASAQFKKVHTIELSESLYNQTKGELLLKGNITPHLGDSRDVLPEILQNVKDNAVFWLDGHYSAGVTAGKDDPCPLLKELEIILCRNNEDIIIIDDARCLLGCAGWPSIFELYKKVESLAANDKFITICDDNIYIIPDDDKYKQDLLAYTLERNAALWNKINSGRKPSKIEKTIKLLKITGLYKPARAVYRRFKKK
ncbi:MAG: class I SAM-dependent methyltransferase [Spirochaetaceae bacterium]|jgi:hypothetical protein|nr:class I SAM-dependent methyltransferase [Spirochaetaceae bacterium]